jgi:carboxyl-terminal processing protease
LPPRTDLPPLAHDIASKPPAGWPKFDATKPATDFQLQEAIKLVNAMPGQTRASN